jgi:hypothetical protein
MGAGYLLMMTVGRKRARVTLVRFGGDFKDYEEPELLYWADVPPWAERTPSDGSYHRGKAPAAPRVSWAWTHEAPDESQGLV